MDDGDFFSIDSRKIIDVCSRALKNPVGLSEEMIRTIHKRRGDAYYDLDQPEKALADYNTLLAATPNDLGILNGKIRVLFILESNEEAWRELKRLLRAYPESPIPYRIAAAAYLEKGDYKSCIHYANEAISRDSEYPVSYFIRADAFIRLGDFAQCEDNLNRFFALRPQAGDRSYELAYLLRGDARTKLGKRQAALADYMMARRLNPSSEALRRIWCWYWRAGKLNMCLYVSDEWVRKEPKNYRAYLAKASSLAGLGRFSEAVAASEKAFSLNNSDLVCLVQMGSFKLITGKSEESLQLLNRALQEDPGNPAILGWLVLVLTLSPEPGIRDGNRAKELALKLCDNKKVKQGEALLLLSLAYGENGEFEKAILEGQRALKLLEREPTLAKNCRIAIESFQKKVKFVNQGSPFQMAWEFEILRFIED
jgi:tetratricopeptide (TPR) repeat protein